MTEKIRGESWTEYRVKFSDDEEFVRTLEEVAALVKDAGPDETVEVTKHRRYEYMDAEGSYGTEIDDKAGMETLTCKFSDRIEKQLAEILKSPRYAMA